MQNNITKKNSTQKIAIIIFIAIFCVSIDRFLKILSSVYLKPTYIIENILQFNFAKNYFIAFSIPFTGLILNITITSILLFLIYHLVTVLKENKIIYSSCLIFIILGTMSNLFDRLKYGYVIDYIDLKYFTVFNIADSMIVCAAACLILIILKEKK
ncbi:hypothetical protein A2331_05350 [Candidatus Falkowbacteria bacterium RIFOXYB2_FULL_34_18]|uniref:Lipoprotein signal peptidase n=1 Tax=Candidatus Falkowbacteria bacterium RIFOXYD2_FULL_34_120 TaxID=1798007 RepID=A0A1F5TR36_9BACT|nr:MAG: hypothetical protein A2331_05350 [Candidatus Falkowbacteria bacterium RIFOXYB2_FULL_34_18]OGF29479.1 MAG: hypothetical protein A2500_04215 [Candidatus Falkowbacteria bacterium RIFOXYC12_FULL_34_55]OGF36296.1 MAG: hypothetical protein A2466_05225 [Candidatus Falkowbacteria bacterium RIFOXYC2_FULL_34_220]OGF39005.1 MAG: hypothetical protein A2515_06680 [Candidatus Falkowbacteria bacterium RIFOXYD12_FULL_34_57]OGF41224.1 MAG: hypothetical protein A2531_00920 [Candidatus Falkowbacteria bact